MKVKLDTTELHIVTELVKGHITNLNSGHTESLVFKDLEVEDNVCQALLAKLSPNATENEDT